jgi:hypothetical protein
MTTFTCKVCGLKTPPTPTGRRWRMTEWLLPIVLCLLLVGVLAAKRV